MSAVARDVTQLNQIRLTGTAMYSGRRISPKVVRGYLNQRYFKKLGSGGVKMAEEQDGVITFSSTNSLKEQQNGEQSLQNNF